MKQISEKKFLNMTKYDYISSLVSHPFFEIHFIKADGSLRVVKAATVHTPLISSKNNKKHGVMTESGSNIIMVQDEKSPNSFVVYDLVNAKWVKIDCRKVLVFKRLYDHHQN